MLETLDPTALISAFTIGLLGAGHCIGMCGGIMGALSFAVPPEQSRMRALILWAYSLGRILSYALIGLLAGLLGEQFAANGGLGVLRGIAGLLLIAMGLYLAGWWMGLTYLEKAGGALWKYLQPVGNKLLPVKSTGSALLLGALWGWLPCGLVYSALAYGMAQGDASASALVMVAFGVGTLPAVLAGSFFSAHIGKWVQSRGMRSVMAILLIVFGVWTLWIAVQHAGHGAHHNHHEHGHEQHAEKHDGHQTYKAEGSSVDKEDSGVDSESIDSGGQRDENDHSHHHHHH